MRRLLIVVTLLCATSLCQDNVAARLDRVVRNQVDKGTFMGAVLVARDGTVLLNQAYGYADLEWSVPNTVDGKFRLGSLTKQFTAAGILLLEERGKLSTSDPVKKYLPDSPAAWDRVTIFHLLTHTSGIPSFTSFADYRSSEPFPTTPEKLVARFRDKPLEFEPGAKWSYSNSGYILLGYLIEKISGKTYQQFAQENLFAPAGMKDSLYDSTSAVIPKRVHGYTPNAGQKVHAGYIDMTIPFSAGGLLSTTGDLLRWEQALFGGKLLSPSSLRKMTTPFLQDYAFGVAVHTENSHKVIEHNGGIEGFNTTLSYFPEDKLVVIVLANMNGRIEPMSQQLACVARGEQCPPPPASPK